MKLVPLFATAFAASAPAIVAAQSLPAPDGVPGAAPAPLAPAPPAAAPPQRPWWADKTTVPYEPGVPGPPGFVLRERTSTGLVIGGSVSFGAAYVMSVATGAMALADEDAGDEDESWGPIFIPVVGPAITAASVHANSVGSFLLVADSVVQTVGVGLFVLGLVDPEREWEADRFEVTVSPGGLSLHGRF